MEKIEKVNDEEIGILYLAVPETIYPGNIPLIENSRKVVPQVSVENCI